MDTLKSISAVIFLACFCISSINAFTCDGLEDGNHANPYDCESFYKCSNGIPHWYACPVPLHFNAALKVCDFPSEANCVPSPSPPPPTTTTTENSVPRFDCTGKPNGLYPNPNDCFTFFKCSNGYDYLYNCPSDLVFDPNNLVCDYQCNVPECGGTGCAPPTTTTRRPATTTTTTRRPATTTTTTRRPTTTTTSAPIPTEPPGDFDCSDKPNGLYPNPDDCRTFYMCSNGYTYLMSCPADLFFHPIRLICDYPENVPQCGGTKPTTTTTTEAPTTEDSAENPCDGKPCGDYPDPSSCSNFYKCSNGEAELRSCPVPLVFNPELRMCDLLENVPSCLCKGKPCGNYPHPSDCNQFYKCSEGETELRTCPVPLVFNPELELCDLLENVPSCGAPPTTTTSFTTTRATTTPTTTTRATTTPTTTLATTTPTTTRATTTPTTTRATATPTTTRATITPTTTRATTTPTTTRATTTPTTTRTTTTPTTTRATTTPSTTTPTTTTSPGQPSCDGLPDGIHPNPYDCWTFLKCSGGNLYIYDCPNDMKFHKDWLVCTLPEDAVCATP